MMTFNAINPLRSFRAAYGLFIVMPLFVFAEFFVFGWMMMRFAPLSRDPEALGFICTYGRVLLAHLFVLLGAGVPTWHWFQQLRQSRRSWNGVVIVVIAIVHYLVLFWWCELGLEALSKYVDSILS